MITEVNELDDFMVTLASPTDPLAAQAFAAGLETAAAQVKHVGMLIPCSLLQQAAVIAMAGNGVLHLAACTIDDVAGASLPLIWPDEDLIAACLKLDEAHEQPPGCVRFNLFKFGRVLHEVFGQMADIDSPQETDQ